MLQGLDAPRFGSILRLQNILTSSDEFAGNEILSERQGQDYRSVYLDLYAEFRKEKDSEKESINADVIFEIELIKQVEINVDYILLLVQEYRDQRGDGDDREIRAEITRAIDASHSLRNNKDLIEAFVDRVSATGAIDEEWTTYVAARRAAELDKIIEDEGLRADETREYVERAFRDGAIQMGGTDHARTSSGIPLFVGWRTWGSKAARLVEARRLLRAIIRPGIKRKS